MQILTFLTNCFGLITSPREVKTLKFWKVNALSLVSFLLLAFIFFITIVTWNKNMRPFWFGFYLMASRQGSIQNCNIFRKWYQKQNPHFKVQSNIGLDLPIILDTWYTTLGSLPNLKIMTSQKKRILHNFEKLTEELDLIS